MAANGKAEWFTIVREALSPAGQEAWDMLTAAQEAFEEVVAKELPVQPGHVIKFGYSYGKRSFTSVAPTVKTGGTLADYLARMGQSGRRA